MQSVDPGILSESVCFPFTPSQSAKELLFYPTWCGHYYCTGSYFMKRDSYPPLLIVYIRKGVSAWNTAVNSAWRNREM